MKNSIKIIGILILTFVLLFVVIKPVVVKKKNNYVNHAKLISKAQEAKKYCKANNLNTDFFILIDLSIHSGINRFFVYDFNKNEFTHKYLVSHGCGNSSWGVDFTRKKAKFSNVNGSHLSSLGKYSIGERGYSNWGVKVKYLMHGLESSNSNALKRAIVFHSWDMVPGFEVYPRGTPEGWGCPAIANQAFREVDKKLKNADKKVLMWIIN